MFDPFSVKFDPDVFELEMLKLQPTSFWKTGHLALIGVGGKKREISFGELPSSLVTWRVDPDSATVTVTITGSAVVCGEHIDETARSYSVTISGPQEKLEPLRKSFLEKLGFTVVR